MAKTKEVVKQKKLPRMKRLRVLLITVVLLLIPVLIYFTLYVSNETDYFNNQNFRQLASISDQIEQRIEGRKVAFNSGIKNALKKHQGAKPITKDEFQKALGTILDAIDEKTPIPAYTKPEDIDRDLDAAKTGIILMTEGETRWLVFVCKIMRSGPDNNKAAQVFPFRARIRLDDLVSPLMDKREIESLKGSEHEAGFDDMLIASLVESRQNTRQQTPEQGSTSKIIFHDGSPEIDVASLRLLMLIIRLLQTISRRRLGGSSAGWYSRAIFVTRLGLSPTRCSSCSHLPSL
ncbi:MAG: hypothetical protein DMF68_08125 [Acidobacteria bacterium]|nr:MAG: hypothetical protein DMF68_08125 [Acidobacteriota bacterium]